MYEFIEALSQLPASVRYFVILSMVVSLVLCIVISAILCWCVFHIVKTFVYAVSQLRYLHYLSKEHVPDHVSDNSSGVRDYFRHFWIFYRKNFLHYNIRFASPYGKWNGVGNWVVHKKESDSDPK